MVMTLGLPDFYDNLLISGEEFYLGESMTHSQDRAGRIYVSETGPRLWRGKVMLVGEVNWDATRHRAYINKIMQPGVRFLIYSRANTRPQSDPYGANLAGTSPTLQHVTDDRKQVRLEGLPHRYEFKAGDAFSWSQNVVLDDAGEVISGEYRYHEFAEDVAVLSNNRTSLFQVNPPVSMGAVIDSPVRLVRPVLKAIYVPQTYKAPTAEGVFTVGGSFQWMQTLE